MSAISGVTGDARRDAQSTKDMQVRGWENCVLMSLLASDMSIFTVL
jgi:hypothetical protein